MEVDEKLFGLVAAAKDQQKTVGLAIRALAGERQALEGVITKIDAQRGRLASDTADATAVRQSLDKLAIEATQALQRSISTLAAGAVADNGVAKWMGVRSFCSAC